MPPNPRPITLQGLSKVLRDHITSTDRAMDRWARQGQQTDRRLEGLAVRGEDFDRRMEALAVRGQEFDRRLEALAVRGEEFDRRLEALAEDQETTKRRVQEMTGGIQVLSGIVGDLARTVARHDEELIQYRDDVRRIFHILEQQGARLEEQGRVLQRLMDQLRGQSGNGGTPPSTP